MTFKVILEDEAKKEWYEAVDWYDKREPGVGLRLNEKIHAVLQTLSRRPERFPLATRLTRKIKVLGRWPYSVYFTFQDLFAAFDLALRNGASTCRVQFDALLAGFKSAFKEERKVRVATTPHLNILSVFGLKSRELCHSRVVAWFLDPNQTHEQGTLFLDAFLRLLGLPPSGSDNVVVQLERPNRVDISVFSPGSFAVCIENKVYHGEPNKVQFANLIKTLNELSEAKAIPREARAAVFLTNDGRQPNSGPAEPPVGIRMQSISRFRMFKTFEDALETAQTKSPLLTSFLSAYVNGIRSLE